MLQVSRVARVGLTVVRLTAVGSIVGCADDLGRERFVWDASAPNKLTTDASRTEDARRDSAPSDADADRPGDGDGDTRDIVVANVDAREASVEAGVVEAGVADASVDGLRDVSRDAPLDAVEGGAGDWGDAGAVRAVLLGASPSCLSCVEASCPSEITGCSTLAGESAGESDGGVARSQLCVETLRCLVSTGCEARDTSTCYCGPNIKPPLLCETPGVAAGVCKSQLERSLESRDPPVILASMFSKELGGGWAMLLARCIRDNGCHSCFRDVDGGTDSGTDAKTP
jgi:hypothetical protein